MFALNDVVMTQIGSETDTPPAEYLYTLGVVTDIGDKFIRVITQHNQQPYYPWNKVPGNLFHITELIKIGEL